MVMPRIFGVSASVFRWERNGTQDRENQTGRVGLPQGRVIVIDTKFTPRPFSTYLGKSTLRPEHLYQMFA